MANIDLTTYDNDPTLYLFTSLTAGSSHIITATSRMETILKANRIPFQAVDTATDEKARRLWSRRASGKKLPGLVREGYVLGDLEQIEEWNEYGELKENLQPINPSLIAAAGIPPNTSSPSVPTPLTSATNTAASSKPPTSTTSSSTPSQDARPENLTAAMRALSTEAAATAQAKKTSPAPLSSSSANKHITIDPTATPEDYLKSHPPVRNATPKTEVGELAAVVSPPSRSKEVEKKVEGLVGLGKEEKKAVEEGGEGKEGMGRSHRGSSVQLASAEEIKAVEESTKIPEEEEDDEDDEDEDEDEDEDDESEEGDEEEEKKVEIGKKVDEGKGQVKGEKPQEQPAKDETKAAESVLD